MSFDGSSEKVSTAAGINRARAYAAVDWSRTNDLTEEQLPIASINETFASVPRICVRIHNPAGILHLLRQILLLRKHSNSEGSEDANATMHRTGGQRVIDSEAIQDE